MISFSTEFPIADENSVEIILELACKWISGSPHSNIPDNEIRKILMETEGYFSIGNERVNTGLINLSDYEIGGFRYVKSDQQALEWTTTIVTIKTPSQHLISIQVNCESVNTASHLPTPRKPYLIKQILQDIGGGMDGCILTKDTPHYLDDGDIDFASQLIIGNGGNSLPIIYISAGFDNTYILDPKKLAQWLSGMAHVIVEPDRDFSLKLKSESYSRNVYGGTVGVYWPDSTARKSYFLTDDTNTPDLLTKLISADIRTALANRRQKSYCNWLHLKDAISKFKYEKLKADGSTELDDFINVFESEISAKQSKIEEAEREIGRLNAELRRLNAINQGRERGILEYGVEQDMYEDEIKNFVIESISCSLKNTLEDSRRCHVLEDLVNTNPLNQEGKRISDEIKSIFKAYVDMDAKLKSSLTSLGFDIAEDGKHYKVTFQGDGRYTFSVSKTSSDHRAGKNLASDMNKKLF